MQKVISTVVAMTLLAGGAALAGDDLSADQLAVRSVVQDAYVDGIHNFRNVEAIRQGFHPGFEMLMLRDGELGKLPIADWIARIETSNAAKPIPPDAPRTTAAAYPLIDVTGDVAVCKVELTREGTLVFTDYLLLYRFAEGWKIVGKAYYRHP